MVTAFEMAIKNAITPQGRASRGEYWWFVLANLIVGIVLAILARVTILFVIVNVLYTLAIILPSIMVAIRRLHDIDKSGWFLLAGFIPILGSIFILVMLARPGTVGANTYGYPPLALPK